MLTTTDQKTVSTVVDTTGTNVKDFSAYSKLTPEQAKRADQIAAAFDPSKDDLAITGFGAQAQTKINEITKPMLSQVKVRDIGPAQEVLKKFMLEIEGVDLDLAYTEPNFIQKIITALDPLVAFLRTLETVDKSLDRLDSDLIKVSGTLQARITTFGQLREEVLRYAPDLFIYSGALEKVRDREIETLDSMIKDAEASPADLTLPQMITVQRNMVTRLRARTFDLNESAMKAFLMIPVIEIAKQGSLMVNDQIQNAIQRVLPDFRMTLAVVIGQWDTARAATTSAQVDQTRQMLNQKLGESLGQTNQAISAMYDEKKKNVESLKNLRDKLVVQIKSTIELDDKLAVQFEEADQAFDDIRNSVRDAVTEMAGTQTAA